MSVDTYKAKLWRELPPTPTFKGNQIKGSTAIRLGFNKVSNMVGKLYISRGAYYNPEVDLTKKAVIQTCIGILTEAGTNYVNKEIEGSSLTFTNLVFDEILGKVPGKKVVSEIVKAAKLINTLATSSKRVQVRDGDALWMYELATKNPSKRDTFTYVRVLMLVDPYRRTNRSSWALHTDFKDLRIFTAPKTFRG